MFGISGEHLLILGIILLVLGPRRLPELGNTLGKAIRNFKDAISGVEEATFRRIDSEKAASAAAAPGAPKAPAAESAPGAKAPQEPPTAQTQAPTPDPWPAGAPPAAEKPGPGPAASV
jgi:TatA/E family protein of Tat protein translocase